MPRGKYIRTPVHCAKISAGKRRYWLRVNPKLAAQQAKADANLALVCRAMAEKLRK